MNLCIDIGNTMSKFGFYQNDELILKCSLFTKEIKCDKDLYDFLVEQLSTHNFQPIQLKTVIISSVVPTVDNIFTNTIKKIFSLNPIHLSSLNPLDYIQTDVSDPKTIGGDLICDLVAGYNRYHSPLIIVDLGTVSKFLLIDRNDKFITCSFFPGMSTLLKDLSHTTSLLPDVDFYLPKKLLECKKTDDAMNSGIIYGTVSMIDGMVERYQKDLGYKCKVILTGGASIYLKSILESKYTFYDTLALDGLNLILKKYQNLLHK